MKHLLKSIVLTGAMGAGPLSMAAEPLVDVGLDQAAFL